MTDYGTEETPPQIIEIKQPVTGGLTKKLEIRSARGRTDAVDAPKSTAAAARQKVDDRQALVRAEVSHLSARSDF
jgi:hypothetical protein